jgi:hypothetical protein
MTGVRENRAVSRCAFVSDDDDLSVDDRTSGPPSLTSVLFDENICTLDLTHLVEGSDAVACSLLSRGPQHLNAMRS